MLWKMPQIMRGDMAQPSIKSPAEDGKNPKLYDLFMNKLTLKANLSGHFKNEHVDLSLFK